MDLGPDKKFKKKKKKKKKSVDQMSEIHTSWAILASKARGNSKEKIHQKDHHYYVFEPGTSCILL